MLAPSSPQFTGRIDRLDATRGIAILGILLMNIFAFALPQVAYMNPTYLGEASQSDIFIWVIFNLFTQGKFLAIFSILFGATLALLDSKGQKWNICRLFLLAILGLIHGIVFWDGDILLAYALTGIIALLLFHQQNDKSLLKIACTIYLIGLVILFILGSQIDATDFWIVSEEQIASEVSQKISGGSISLIYRVQSIFNMTEMLVIQYGWQLLGLMVFGALMLKNGWLSGQFSQEHYRRIAIILILPALLIQLLSLYVQSLFGWSFFATSIVGYIVNELVIPFQSFGYIALIYGFWGSVKSTILAKMVQCVGRMALSNYLLQTLICTTIFYHFGYFNQFSRLALLGFIIPIWVINLLFSYGWLRLFKQGPVEFCWRVLTEKVNLMWQKG